MSDASFAPDSDLNISAADGAISCNEDLEWLLLAGAIRSYPVFQLLRPHVCPAITQLAPRPGDVPRNQQQLFRYDFVRSEYNELWPVIHRYWRTLSRPVMAVRRERPVPQLWSQVLSVPGVYRNPSLEERLWTVLAPFLALEESPLNESSATALMQGTLFTQWRVMAATRDGTTNLVQNLSANRVYSPQDILQAARAIKEASVPHAPSFTDKLQQIMQGEMDAHVKPIPLGLRELDLDLYGGLPAGSAMLVAGFTGSGKTVVAGQFGLSAIRADVPTLLISTEISVRAYLTRLVSNGLKFDYGTLQKHQMTAADARRRHWPPEITDDPVRSGELAFLQQQLNQFLRIEDWSLSAETTVEDSLEPLLELYMENGFKPRYVLLDWLSPSTIKVGRNQQDWMGYEKAAEAFVRAMKRFGTTGVLFAQLADCPNSGKLSNPGIANLAHSKKMANFMPFFLGISRLEERAKMTVANNLPVTSHSTSAHSVKQYWHLAKARDFPTRLYTVKANFAQQRFEPWT